MTDIETRIAELEKEKALLVLEVHNKNKRMAELEAEVTELEDKLDQASCYEEGFEEGYTAAKKELIRESRDYWNRVLVSLGVNNYDCATYLAEYNKTIEGQI